MPLISISLPTRNRLKFIQRTIAQIQAQTFTDWELIISDNASDEAGKVDYLKQLAAADPRVKLHLQPINIGIHANWIFGINQCIGRYYIATTDDDCWGEPEFLESLLAIHDGKTGVVYPNLSIDFPESGRFENKTLTELYRGPMTRYEFCDKLVNDRRGIVMMGLFDLGVIPKKDINSVYDHGRHGHCEIGGMIRLARNYPMKFRPEVSYIHTSYSGNYLLNCASEIVMRDSGIGTFQLLDELRLAAADDPGYGPALASQWKIAVRFSHALAASWEIKSDVVVARTPKKKNNT